MHYDQKRIDHAETLGYAPLLTRPVTWQHNAYDRPVTYDELPSLPTPVTDLTGAPAAVSDSGAIRSKLYPKLTDFDIRLDLVFNNPVGLRRLAETYGEGAKKYGPNNWKRGFPESVFLSHALEHVRLYMAGDNSEDHIAHACWNLFTLMHFQETRPDLMDITGEQNARP